MIDLFLIVTWGLALCLVPFFGLMAAVLTAAFWSRLFDTPSRFAGEATTRFLFVIPAHDEEAVVGITVQSCQSVKYDRDRFQICVIADNCTDFTARVAEAAGALVMVRTDLMRKSKGFALEDFFAGIAANPAIQPHEAYVLVDADSSVDPAILQTFDQSLRRGDNFIQGYYSVRNADASWRTRLMTYAFSLANGVWLAGLDRLGLSAGLKGNGMCFRRDALQRFPWQASGLVEDMEFAWNLRVGGERVRFQPQAQVYGEMVSRGGSGAASQRRRWESGRQALRATFRARIAKSTHLTWLQKLVYWIDLDFPPLGRLMVWLTGTIGLAAIGIAWSHGSAAWVAVLGGLVSELFILLAYVVAPFIVMNLPLRYVGSLAYLPYYLGWKLLVGVLKAPQQWVRTPRETPSN